MIKSIAIELLIVATVGVLAFLTLSPVVMPMGVFLTTLLALTVLFGFFATYLWREQGGDEREEVLRYRADRTAFLAGSSILLVAIIVEGIMMHMTDPWVLGAFAAMILAKAVAHIYNQHKH
jgi:hypothetical protein